MKNIAYLLILLAGVFVSSCDSNDALPYGYIETTETGSSTYVLKGYDNGAKPEDFKGYNYFEADGFDKPFYILNKALVGESWHFAKAASGVLSGLTKLPAEDAWLDNAPIQAGVNYWARFNAGKQYKYLKIRIAYIEGNNVGLEYILAQVVERDVTVNANANGGDKESAKALEVPALNVANIYAEYFVGDQQNFVLEYVAEKKHSAWVAFSFDAITAKQNVKRQDAWEQDDPNIDNAVEVTEAMHKSDGYDKGHLVGRADRSYTADAAKQTYYYANISPMISDFNQKFWSSLENQVQAWGAATIPVEPQTSASDVEEGEEPFTLDKLYVAKGGTANKLLTNFEGWKWGGDSLYPTADAEGKTKHGLIVPAYYFMAVLSEKAGEYHAIGFYVPHSENLPSSPKKADLQKYAVSIDDLERETGIDFFCNLPDYIEDDVERAYDKNDWEWN